MAKIISYLIITATIAYIAIQAPPVVIVPAAMWAILWCAEQVINIEGEGVEKK